MNDEDMEPFIFALGRKRTAKSMLKNERDLKDYASIVDSPRPKKLADDLTIISESRDLVADLLPESVLDLVRNFGLRQLTSAYVIRWMVLLSCGSACLMGMGSKTCHHLDPSDEAGGFMCCGQPERGPVCAPVLDLAITGIEETGLCLLDGLLR